MMISRGRMICGCRGMIGWGGVVAGVVHYWSISQFRMIHWLGMSFVGRSRMCLVCGGDMVCWCRCHMIAGCWTGMVSRGR